MGQRPDRLSALYKGGGIHAQHGWWVSSPKAASPFRTICLRQMVSIGVKRWAWDVRRKSSCNAIHRVSCMLSFCPAFLNYNLHCSQTTVNLPCTATQFYPGRNLHCSQTHSMEYRAMPKFYPGRNLHCSQTIMLATFTASSFYPGRNLHCSQTW